MSGCRSSEPAIILQIPNGAPVSADTDNAMHRCLATLYYTTKVTFL